MSEARTRLLARASPATPSRAPRRCSTSASPTAPCARRACVASTPTRPPSGASASASTTSCSTRCRTCGPSATRASASTPSTSRRTGSPRHRALHPARPERRRRRRPRAGAAAGRAPPGRGRRPLHPRGQLGRARGSEEPQGLDITGTTLGIVGLGNIGQAVARRAEAFGMRVVGWNRTPRPETGIEQMPLDDLLAAIRPRQPALRARRHHARPDRRARAGAAAADRGADQHGARRHRRHTRRWSPRCRAIACGVRASTCSRRSRRSTHGCSSTRAWS